MLFKEEPEGREEGEGEEAGCAGADPTGPVGEGALCSSQREVGATGGLQAGTPPGAAGRWGPRRKGQVMAEVG